jgi:hypothetical protein
MLESDDPANRDHSSDWVKFKSNQRLRFYARDERADFALPSRIVAM